MRVKATRLKLRERALPSRTGTPRPLEVLLVFERPLLADGEDLVAIGDVAPPRGHPPPGRRLQRRR